VRCEVVTCGGGNDGPEVVVPAEPTVTRPPQRRRLWSGPQGRYCPKHPPWRGSYTIGDAVYNVWPAGVRPWVAALMAHLLYDRLDDRITNAKPLQID
jgi:hypothetical protein